MVREGGVELPKAPSGPLFVTKSETTTACTAVQCSSRPGYPGADAVPHEADSTATRTSTSPRSAVRRSGRSRRDAPRRSVQLGRMRVPDEYDADAGITNP